MREQRALAAEFNEATLEQLQSHAYLTAYEQKNEEVLQRLDRIIEDEIRTHPNSLHSMIAFSSYKRVRKPTEQTIRRIEQLFGDVYQANRSGSIEEQNRKKAFPFELKDTLGYVHRMDDFKGKTVVMDFWFTGCKGCVEVARMLSQEVKPAFENDTNVVFIAVSTDINFLDWKKSVRRGLDTSEGQLNLFTNGMGSTHPIYDYYRFSGAPQMVVIDPRGYVRSTSVILNGPELVALIKEAR